MARRAARRRLPPEGRLGSDTSINLQETSIPRHTPTSSPSCSSSSLSRHHPLSAVPQAEENLLVPRAKEPNNKYLYFPLLPTWSILICHGFLSQLSIGLSLLVFFPPFPVSSLSQALSVNLSLIPAP